MRPRATLACRTSWSTSASPARSDGPWVAVFLDGPDYAKRATVADRETLPYGVLREFMGWARVERIWLPDWVRDRDEVIGRIRLAASDQEPRPSSSRPTAMNHDQRQGLRRAAVRRLHAPVWRADPSIGRGFNGAGASWIRSHRRGGDGRRRPDQRTVDHKGRRPEERTGSLFVPAHDDTTGERQLLDELDRDPRCRAAVPCRSRT